MWTTGIKDLEKYGWKLKQKKPVIILQKINNIGDNYLFPVTLNLEKYHTIFKDIIDESYKIKLPPGTPKRERGANIYLSEYLITKHKYLCQFFDECKNKKITENNIYYKWLTKCHKLNEKQEKKYFNICFDKQLNDERQIYTGVFNKKDAFKIAKLYQNHFLDIQNNGLFQPMYIQRAVLQLPGITDATNRYAMFKVLNYKKVELIVNQGTYNIMKKYDLIIN